MTEHLTPQQEAFLDTAPDKDSIALRARAGTGKTFSLRKWAAKSRAGGMATSFSKSTVQELTAKMPPKFQAKTMHGIGYQAIRNSGTFSKMDANKLYELCKTFSDDNEIPFEQQADLRKLVSLGKTFGIQPDPKGPEGLVPDEQFVWEELADNYDIELGTHTIEFARALLQESNTAALKDGLIDFDDMLYIALLWPHKFPRFPVILADEVQDFNALQHRMLGRLLLPNGRLVAAGDDRQAIYAFRGALSDSYTQLVNDFDMRELPLTASFRCPRAVIHEAQKFVPDIESHPNAIEGAVEYPYALSLADVPKTVLCRNNAPLMRLALALLVSGRTVEMAGRDIGQHLIALTKRITKKKDMPSIEFLDRLTTWKQRELERYPRRRPSINDKFSALAALAMHHRTLADIRQHLEKLYPKDSDNRRPADVHLSTIHRAKGREWPRVLFLDQNLIGKHAKKDQEILQEQNLAYVGVTRAQQELVYCSSTDIEGVGEER